MAKPFCYEVTLIINYTQHDNLKDYLLGNDRVSHSFISTSKATQSPSYPRFRVPRHGNGLSQAMHTNYYFCFHY
jgi:hypothetical protein